jgi:PilZ domain
MLLGDTKMQHWDAGGTNMAAAATAMEKTQSLVGAQDTRSCRRYLVLASRTITWGGGSHLALVRDISRSGAFVYSNFRPALGDNIEIVTGRGRESCRITGAVVRVESHAAGAAIGIAIRVVDRKLTQ